MQYSRNYVPWNRIVFDPSGFLGEDRTKLKIMGGPKSARDAWMSLFPRTNERTNASINRTILSFGSRHKIKQPPLQQHIHAHILFQSLPK